MPGMLDENGNLIRDMRHAPAARLLVASPAVREFFVETLENLSKAALYGPDPEQRERARCYYLALESVIDYLSEIVKEDDMQNGSTQH